MRKVVLKAVTLLLVLFATHSTFADTIPKVNQGILDAKNFNFFENKLALRGYWMIYDQQLLSLQECRQSPGLPAFFPSIWNDERPSRDGQGFATYYLKVYLKQPLPTLAIEVPQLYSCYALWINGKKLAENGKVGTTEESTIPQWMPLTVKIPDQQDTLHVVLQLGNFHHYKGGAKEDIYIGTVEMLTKHRDLSYGSTIVEIIVLILIAILTLLLLYMQPEKRKIIIYFTLLSFSWAIRAAFSNQYVVTYYIPDFNWNILVKVEYITIYLSMIWGILFLSRLFPNEGSNIIKYLLVTFSSFFIAFTVITPPMVFTRWLPVYLTLTGILLVYAAYIVIRAIINEQSGVWYLVVSIGLGVVTFGYDIFAFGGWVAYNPVIRSVAYIVMFLCLAAALLFHLGIFKSSGASNVLTFDDLYKKEK